MPDQKANRSCFLSFAEQKLWRGVEEEVKGENQSVNIWKQKWDQHGV